MNPMQAITRHTGKRSAGSAYANCKLWRNRLLQRPDDPNTLCGLAEALLESGQREEAEFTVRSALALEPDMPEAHYVLGKLLHERGSYHAAVAQYRHALTFGANTGDIWNDLGCSLASLDDAVGAREAFRTALRLAPHHAQAHNHYGESLRAQGQLRDAMQSFAMALRLEPGLTAAGVNLATGLVSMNRAATAIPLLKRCVRDDPASAPALLQLGLARQQLGDYARAAECFEGAADLAPSAAAYGGLGTCLAATEDYVAAVAAYREATKLAPDDTRLLEAFAAALLAAGMTDKAADVGEQLVGRRPVSTRALAAHAVAAARTSDDPALHSLLDFEQLVHGGTISVPSGYPTLQAYNAILHQYVTAHPTLSTVGIGDGLLPGPQTATRSVTGPLLSGAVQPIAELERQVNAAVRGYLQHFAPESGHPLLDPVPAGWQMTAHGVVLEARSPQPRHIRPGAWLAAVYFIKLPSAVTHGKNNDGCLQLGGAPTAIDPERRVPER
ncbi:MAG: tetratricopeptide repeat protein, partial [Pseudomonadota bacterium]